MEGGGLAYCMVMKWPKTMTELTLLNNYKNITVGQQIVFFERFSPAGDTSKALYNGVLTLRGIYNSYLI